MNSSRTALEFTAALVVFGGLGGLVWFAAGQVPPPRNEANNRGDSSARETRVESRTATFAPTQPIHAAPNESPQSDGTKATASLVLGIVSIPGACLPILGIPLGIIGLIFGIKEISSVKANLAIAGVACSGAGLALGVVNGFIWAMVIIFE